MEIFSKIGVFLKLSNYFQTYGVNHNIGLIKKALPVKIKLEAF